LLNQNNKTSMSKEYNFDSDGEYEILITGIDENGEDCEAMQTITVDSTKPELIWINPVNNDSFEDGEEIELKAEATDETAGIKKVIFYVKNGTSWTELGNDSTESNDEFSYLWTPETTGEIELKATARDNAENETEKTITITIGEAAQAVSNEWIYSETEVKQMLLNAGVNESIASQAAELINELNASRTIKLVKVGSNYEVLIEISFTNTDQTKHLKVIELIPKTLSENASLIESNYSFTVIQADPVIEFSFSNIEPYETKTFTYTIANGLSKEEADALASKALTEFIAPPMIVNSGTNTSQLFSKGSTDIGLIAIIAAIIILLVLFIAGILGTGGYAIHRYKKKGGNTGWKSEGKPESGSLHSVYAGAKTEPGFMDSIKGLFKSEEPQERKPKFSYKGK
ncbi:MAG: Ig-like domain-containing protein, partial [Candidatus Diapherotrites archaeon]